MITTRTAVKAALGLTGTDKDSQIDALLPSVEYDLLAYCNNKFLNGSIGFSGDVTPTVAAGPVYSFVCADGGMDDEHLAVGDVIYAYGSVRNDGFYTITAIADGAITVTEALVAEDEIAMDLQLVQFPRELAFIVARMVGYQLSSVASAGLKSEDILDYSYTRDSTSGAGYPAEILRALDRYRRMKVGFGSVVQHYADRRGSWVGGVIR